MTKAATPKASTTTTKKKETSASALSSEAIARRKAISAATQSFIQKATSQKPLGLREGTWPHIASGSITVDHLIGGVPLPDGSGLVCPGYPKGRMFEVFGPESSGKTTLALAAIVSVQKAGGIAMFLDFENSLHHGYARSVGVDFDTDKLLYYSPETLEEGWKMLYIAIKQKVDIVVLDSLAAMVPAKELEKGIGDPAAIGAQARFLSNYLPKMVQWQKTSPTFVMFLNQPRATISANSNASDTNTAGGKAVKFYASGRLMLVRIRSDYVEKVNPLTLKKGKVPYGNVTVVKVVKNKMAATQGFSAMIFIRYGSGVDEYLGIIETAIPRRFVTKNSSSYGFNGETFKGKDRLRAYLMENPKAFEALKEKISLALLEEAPKGGEIAEDDEIKSGTLEDDDEAFESGEDTSTEGIEDIEASVEESIGL